MLYVARHGQTQWNAKNIIQGQSDIPLNETGYQQAVELAKEVGNLDEAITKIISSPLQRAKETARVVAEHNGLSVAEDKRLIELDYGDFDGTSGAGEGFLQARKEFALRFPNGESFMDVYARVVPLLSQVVADEENIYLLVCHNSLIRVIMTYFEPVNNEAVFEYRTPNAKLIKFN